MSAKTANGPKLLPETEELFTAANFASVATLLPSGKIQNQVIWTHIEDGQVVLNTETHRIKYLNLQREPRITVLVRDEQDPYRYAEVRGHVAEFTTGDRARNHVDELAHKYLGKDYPPEAIKSERVIIRITPERQTFIDQNNGVAD